MATRTLVQTTADRSLAIEVSSALRFDNILSLPCEVKNRTNQPREVLGNHN